MQPWLLRFVIPSDIPIVGGVDLSLPSFFFLLTLGFMLSTFVILKEAARSGVQPKQVLDLSLWVLAATMVGGRVGHVVLSRPRYFLEHPDKIFDVWHGGINLLGALPVALLVSFLWVRRHKLNFWQLADIFAPALSFCLIFAGLGCLSAGCFYGKPIDFPWGMDWPWGIVFYGGQVPEILRGIALHPTQLYLSFLHVVLFWGLILLRRKQRFDGQVALSWALGFSAFGLLLEPFRFGFDRPVLPGGEFMVSQLIFALLIGVSLWMWRQLSKKKMLPRPRIGVADRAPASSSVV